MVEVVPCSEHDVYAGRLENGYVGRVVPMIFNARLYVEDPKDKISYVDAFCYDNAEQAIAALRNWNTNESPEPDGWKKHPATGRRRPDGDKSKEYVDKFYGA